MPIGVIEAMLTDFTDEELKAMGYLEEEIDGYWSTLIRHDMNNY